MLNNHREGYDSPEYKAWRYAVFARDKWTCSLCPRKGGELEAHHIKRWADAPHLRYAVSNGITLCTQCHGIVTGREEDYEDQFRRLLGMKHIQKEVKSAVLNAKAKKFGQKFKWRPRNPKLRF